VVAYNTDEEQIEALKNWWSENGTSLLVTIAVVLAVVFGYQTWQGRVKANGEEASDVYEEFRAAATSRMGQFVGSNHETARFLTETLINDHEDSVYASMASLQMAKLEVNKKNLEQAEQDLKWVVVHDANGEFGTLARLRLARVVAARGEVESALELLNGADSGPFKSSYEEAKGDFYLLLKRDSEARTAYQAALDALTDKDSNPILQMKLDDIAVTGSNVISAQEEVPATGAAGSAEEDLTEK